MSDGNAYAESLFCTAKHRLEFPARGFADLEAARAWAVGFVQWYNVDHRHSATKVKIGPSWQPVTRCTCKREGSTQRVGLATHSTGRRLRRSLSTRNVTASSRRIRVATIFSGWPHE